MAESESAPQPALVRAALLLAVLPAAAVVVGLIGTHGLGLLFGSPDSDAESLLAFLYRDDAYYCFEWALSVVRGEGPRIGAGPATSGVHVLWELVLLLPALAGRAAVEHWAAPLGLLAWAGGALLLGRAVGAEVGGGGARWAGWFTALLLLGAPWVALEAANGQETGLAVLAFAWLLHRGRAGTASFTCAAVLATLARSDLFLFVVAVAWRRSGGWSARVLAPAVALAVYAAVNVALAGHPLQDSAEPMAWLFRQHFLATDPGPADWLGALWWWGRPVLLGDPFARWGLIGSACLIAASLQPVAQRWRRSFPLALPLLVGAAWAGLDDLAVPCLGVGLALLPVAGQQRVGPTARESLPLLAAAVGLVALHSLVRWYPRDYYWVPLAVVGSWALGRTVAAGGPRAAAALLGFAVLLGIDGYQLVATDHPAPRRQSEVAMDLASRHLLEVAPGLGAAAAGRIGSFNCGQLAWRSGARVVNLDGVVNRPALRALQAGELRAYLDREDIRWLCDNPLQFGLDPTVAHACGHWFGDGFDPARDLVEQARFVDTAPPPGRAGTDVVSLYRRGGDSPAAPSRLAWLRDTSGTGRRNVLVWVGQSGEQLLRGRIGGAGEVLADAVPGVPLVLSVVSPPTGETTEIYVRGRELPILHHAGPR